MPFHYKKVLVIGATSSIGEALAEKFLANGSRVITVGRRRERLAALEEKHGKDKATAITFNITQTEKIPDYRGIQRGFDFSKPETVDISMIQDEFNTDYLDYLALTKAFLPFLLAKKEESALIYTTSALALVPILRCPNYCASKAALHHFILCLREQLKQSRVKVVEIYRPAVQIELMMRLAELHDEVHQPDIKNGRSIGMPLGELTDEAYEGLVAGKEGVAVGISKNHFDGFEKTRLGMFHRIVAAMAGR